MTALQSVSSPLILTPAYGKAYASREAMLKGWQNGDDFRMVGWGQYCSIRNIEALRADSSSVSLYEFRLNVTVKV